MRKPSASSGIAVEAVIGIGQKDERALRQEKTLSRAAQTTSGHDSVCMERLCA
jgi:hypothetical protein